MTDANEKIVTKPVQETWNNEKSHHPKTQGPSSLWLPWWFRRYRICRQSEDPGLIPGWERSPGEGNGYPLPFSSLENPVDRGTWQAIACGVTESRTWLSDTFILIYSSRSLLALLAMCNFMYSLYQVLGFREMLYGFFSLLFFPSYFFFSGTVFFTSVGKIFSLLLDSCFYFVISNKVCILLNGSLFRSLLKAVLISIVSLKSSDNVLLNAKLRLKFPTAGSPESLPFWIFSVLRW